MAASAGVKVASAVALDSGVSSSGVSVDVALTTAGWVASDVPSTEDSAVSVRLAVGVKDCADSVGSLPLIEHANVPANKANAQRISFCLRISIRSPCRLNNPKFILHPFL